MNYKTHNDKEIDVNFSSFQGNITTDYSVLKKLFGVPGIGDDYKVSAEWDIEFEDGVIATIYDYKTSKKYCGNKTGVNKTNNKYWHVGGFDKKALYHVQTLLSELK